MRVNRKAKKETKKNVGLLFFGRRDKQKISNNNNSFKSS